jgi:hypothetical protein
MTTRAQTIIQDYRLDPKCMRRFAEAMNRGCLVLPSSSGLYSQIPRAWEAYCLEPWRSVCAVTRLYESLPILQARFRGRGLPFAAGRVDSVGGNLPAGHGPVRVRPPKTRV